MFIEALERGDGRAARAMLSHSQQRDAAFLTALPRTELQSIAEWYRSYRFAGVWEDQVEFAPTRERPGELTRSLYVRFTPGDDGVVF